MSSYSDPAIVVAALGAVTAVARVVHVWLAVRANERATRRASKRSRLRR